MKKLFLWALVTVLTVCTGVLGGALYGLLKDMPQVEVLEDYRPGLVTAVYGDNDQVLAEFFEEKRRMLPFEKIPPFFIKALIAVEDSDFYSHWGVNFKGIARALWVDIKAGKIVQGGSTLTQQLAKVLFLSPERTISRKLKELLLTLQLEKKYTKNEILAMYCNQIYLGSGSYGLEAAARTYFGKRASALDLPRLALLAGLPKSPEGYSPLNNPRKAVERRNLVLKRMREEGYISEGEYNKARRAPLELSPPPSGPSLFADHFIEMVRRRLEGQYGVNMLYRKGLKVYTTLNPALQRAAEKAVRDGMAALRERQKIPPGAELRPEAALLCLEHGSGHIKAMVGGLDYKRSKFNRALQARRQPGSAFKPVIYAAALDGDFTAASIVADEELSVVDEHTGKEWRPQNFDKEYLGPVTLRKGLEDSRNVVSVKLLRQVGIPRTLQYAQRLGLEGLHPYLSLALGTAEVSLWELTAAYGVFANGGVRVEPDFIRYVTDNEGKILEESFPARQRALSKVAAYLVTSLLRGVVEEGTGRRARALGRPAAGKTGTTDNYMDAWFVGYIPQLTTGVWVGYDRKKSLGKLETGSRAALPIWTDFMKKAAEYYPRRDFRVPEGVVFAQVDSETGLLAAPGCPDTLREAFRRGSEPVQYCRAHDVQDARQEGD